MSDTLLRKEHLEKIIDEAIKDIEGGGAVLFDLAGLLNTIGNALDDPVYHSLVGPIASYGSELLSSRPLIELPILTSKIRDNYRQKFDEAVEDGKKSLNIIKQELCNDEDYDFSRIVKALAKLGKHDMKLGQTRATLMRTTFNPQSSE